MGALEPDTEHVPLELCILGEVIAPTVALANTIANLARIGALHFPYPGQVRTTGHSIVTQKVVKLTQLSLSDCERWKLCVTVFSARGVRWPCGSLRFLLMCF